MSKIKKWFSDHKELLISAGAFVLGYVVRGIISENDKPTTCGVSVYDIYNNAAHYANSIIIPNINAKYNCDLTEDPQMMKQYNEEYAKEWNKALAVEVMKSVGYKDYDGNSFNYQ